MPGFFPVLYFCFPRFFLTIVVVQVVQVPWLPEETEGHVTPKLFPWKSVRINRKLRNIHPSGAFSPEKTSSNIAPKWFPWKSARMRNRKLRNIRSNVTRRTSPGKYGSARICSLCYVVLQGYFLSRPRSHCGISTKWMKLVNVTRSDAIKPKVGVSALFLVFSDIFEVFVMLCSTPRMLSITSAFSLWYFY